ncbi:cobalt-precorrin-6A reductase [Sphingomonas pokkalii]|uniref:Cobalt-precorrin-6A reductase n=1 Tax=Sphingomonas pokkalii TaxID=2175090 RepID=A0A2U0SG18_9SPHN|nr:cobalt-precorrin-6A reductase [Sphingomonas pokkalii]PVX30316.1 cobalt-precorrin-6A reductase [Sphingomonas pokkalii]
MPNVLLLGGTTEASALARLLAEQGVETTLSYAGRTDNPRQQPVPVRIGGFGGVEGLARYLREQRVTHLVDATHPFAATMSANAVMAAQSAGVPLIALTRPAWCPTEEDRWTRVADIAGAVAALAGPAKRILLALGRMHVAAFAAQPQHHYVLRFVDVPGAPPALPDHHLIVDRGPFTPEADHALMAAHEIDLVVCKNAGGSGAEAKLIAARRRGIPVLMIDRPALPARREVARPEAVLAWLGHAPSTAKRGV